MPIPIPIPLRARLAHWRALVMLSGSTLYPPAAGPITVPSLIGHVGCSSTYCQPARKCQEVPACQERLESLSRMPATSAQSLLKRAPRRTQPHAKQRGSGDRRQDVTPTAVVRFQLLLPCPTCPPISCQALRCQVSHAAAAQCSTTDHHHAWRAQSIDSAHLSSGRQTSVPSNDRPPEIVACPPSCLQRAHPLSPPSSRVQNNRTPPASRAHPHPHPPRLNRFRTGQ